jgi:UDP-3-O-[3-hydroxymyristoyl] glucosamine N-acyltransferase
MTQGSLTLGDVADRLGLECRGDRARRVIGLANLALAEPDQLSFLANPKYRKFLQQTRAGAVILSPKVLAELDPAEIHFDYLVADNPYLGYARASHLFDRRLPCLGTVSRSVRAA